MADFEVPPLVKETAWTSSGRRGGIFFGLEWLDLDLLVDVFSYHAWPTLEDFLFVADFWSFHGPFWGQEGF